MNSQLSELAVSPEGLPKAAADQRDVQAFEHGMLALARVHHPGVHWWHGYRAADEGFGSFCYICERFIVTWAGNGSPPVAARELIHQHKNEHRVGVVPPVQSK